MHCMQHSFLLFCWGFHVITVVIWVVPLIVSGMFCNINNKKDTVLLQIKKIIETKCDEIMRQFSRQIQDKTEASHWSNHMKQNIYELHKKNVINLISIIYYLCFIAFNEWSAVSETGWYFVKRPKTAHFHRWLLYIGHLVKTK